MVSTVQTLKRPARARPQRRPISRGTRASIAHLIRSYGPAPLAGDAAELRAEPLPKSRTAPSLICILCQPLPRPSEFRSNAMDWSFAPARPRSRPFTDC
jgi:hypothetical protein